MKNTTSASSGAVRSLRRGELRSYIFKDAAKNRVYVRRKPEPGAKGGPHLLRTLASRGASPRECRLGTGRTHQIRAQMAAAGTPFSRDGKYGSDRENKSSARTASCSTTASNSPSRPTPGLKLPERQELFRVRVDFAEKYFPDIRFLIDKHRVCMYYAHVICQRASSQAAGSYVLGRNHPCHLRRGLFLKA